VASARLLPRTERRLVLHLIALPRDALALPRLARAPALVAQQMAEDGQPLLVRAWLTVRVRVGVRARARVRVRVRARIRVRVRARIRVRVMKGLGGGRAAAPRGGRAGRYRGDIGEI